MDMKKKIIEKNLSRVAELLIHKENRVINPRKIPDKIFLINRLIMKIKPSKL